MQGRAASGGAEIAGGSRDGRKFVRGNTTLFGEERDEAWIWLVSCKTSYSGSSDSAAELNGGDGFLHARDGGARKRFAVELDIEAAFLRIRDLDRGGVLSRATKKEFTQTIASIWIGTSAAAKKESAGTVTEESAKFAGDSAGCKSPAMDVSRYDRDGLCSSRPNQRLCDRERIEQPEASAANVERATIFADEQSRMKLRRE